MSGHTSYESTVEKNNDNYNCNFELLFTETSCGRLIVLTTLREQQGGEESDARMSVEMVLAECQHHSAQRQKEARAREEEREVHCTAVFRTTVPPPEPELFDLFEEPGGVRPNLLLEPRDHRDRFSGTPWCSLALRADPRCACAADGEPTCGIHAAV